MKSFTPVSSVKSYWLSRLTFWFTLCSFLISLQAHSLAIYDSIWVNNDTVGRYDKLEVSVIMTAQYMNPFDYSQVNLKGQFTSPSGTVYKVDGFYFQDYQPNPPDGPLILNGSPYWKIRFCPKETGTWSYMVVCKDATGTSYSAAFQFVCIPSSHPGFVGSTDTYFQKFSNGQPFFPIGMSIPWNLYAGGFYIYETWMDSLIASHANFIKIIMAPWSFGIEWSNTGLGNYTNRQNIAWWLDWVLNKAEAEGLYLQLCPLIHNEVSTLSNNDWQWSPYNAANGGPCQNTWNFYTNSTARYYYKQKLRYINARWGYSSHLSAWELFTEADNTGDFDGYHDEITSWLTVTGQYLDSLDINHRPISPSYANFSHDPEMWDNSMTDFTQIHLYKTTPDLELALWAGTRHYLTQWDKPNIIGEFGLGHSPTEIIALDPTGISLHNSLWATALSGSFGAATPWHWDSYIHTQHLYRHFKPVALFMQLVPLLEKNYQPVSVFCRANNNMDTEILPGYKSLFSPSPENEFTVETCGDLVPRNSYLSYMLYGYLYSGSRNPPHFFVNYTKPGQFKVKTGSNVFLSTLKIYIDGVKVLDHAANPNSTYSVDVVPGNHEIFVDNSGTSFIEVEKYVFTNYAPVCRSFALKDPTQVSGWVQNRYYNHEYINQYGTPSPLSGGVMNFPGLNNSYYSFQWYNGATGLPDSSFTKAVTNGNLVVNVPGIVWDAAYKITALDSGIEAGFTVSDSLLCKGDTAIFNDISTGIITGRQWQFPGGLPAYSTLPNPKVAYNTAGMYSVTLKVYNAFDTIVMMDTLLMHVRGMPQVAGTINGPQLVCQGEGPVMYQVSPIGDADTYLWTLPPGATGTSTSPSILVSFSLQFTSGTIKVRGVNMCGQGPEALLTVTVPPLPEITQQPESTVAEFSQNASFQVPYHEYMNYQWQTIHAAGEGWTDLADTGSYQGASTHALSIISVTPVLNDKPYRCTVSGSCAPPVISQEARLYVVPPGWMMALNPTHHKIHILVSAQPTINGQPIMAGDYIGVFFGNDGQATCAGATRWKGTMPVDILAYGDDPTTPVKDGFAGGESFHWKIYSMSGEEDFNAIPEYVLGPHLYTEGAQTLLGGLSAFRYIDSIALPPGWSGISSYVVPVNDSVMVMFESAGESVEILADLEYIYWPDGGLYSLQTWNPYQGYYARVADGVSVLITGSEKAGTEVSLVPGWNLLPVLSPSDIPTMETTILSGLGDNLVLVKEIAGPKIYWPSMNIFTLTALESGRAYLIRVMAPCTVQFPDSP